MEHTNSHLTQVVILLATAIFIVPIFKRLGLGAVLGYLVAGALLGPSGLAFFENPELIVHFAELGVVMFLFIIGLEMYPERLWSLKGAIFGRGLLQVVSAGCALTFLGTFLFGLPLPVAFIAGAGFSLSSTAIVMQVLEERGISHSAGGQRIVSTLIFEDLAIVPLLASIALLSPMVPETEASENLQKIKLALAAVGFLVLMGRWLINPIFRLISKSKIRELMTASALLVVLGAAVMMEIGGLSMAMGAFVAGVMLSESSFRHQLEADIEPFRGLLLGLFFMGVGMSLNLQLVYENYQTLLKFLAVYVGGKALVVFIVGMITGVSKRESLSRMVIMAHGGEFAFVLFATAAAASVISYQQQALFTAAVISSMLVSPLLLFIKRVLVKPEKNQQNMDDIELAQSNGSRVLVLGFGRFNQIVCQTLLASGIDVYVIENNIERIRSAAKFGFKVYYGDGSRLDILRACGIERVNCVVLGIPEGAASARIVEDLKKEYPTLKIFARTHDHRTAIDLIKAGVDYQIRETLESAFTLGNAVLQNLGLDEVEAADVVTKVRALDTERLNDELLHGISAERIKKYWQPQPIIKSHHHEEASHEHSGEIKND